MHNDIFLQISAKLGWECRDVQIRWYQLNMVENSEQQHIAEIKEFCSKLQSRVISLMSTKLFFPVPISVVSLMSANFVWKSKIVCIKKHQENKSYICSYDHKNVLDQNNFFILSVFLLLKAFRSLPTNSLLVPVFLAPLKHCLDRKASFLFLASAIVVWKHNMQPYVCHPYLKPKVESAAFAIHAWRRQKASWTKYYAQSWKIKLHGSAGERVGQCRPHPKSSRWRPEGYPCLAAKLRRELMTSQLYFGNS